MQHIYTFIVKNLKIKTAGVYNYATFRIKLKQEVAFNVPETKSVDSERKRILLSIKRGIHLWFYISDSFIAYIGIAVCSGGLKRRIIQQYLNQKYLEYRPEKYT